MKAVLKKCLIILILLLVIGAIIVTLMFTLMNGFKFMTYTSSKMNKVYAGFDTQKIRFIAHRGLSDEEFQNTAAAFELAADNPDVWGIETDIWVTSDGRFVCMHDADSLEGVDNIRNITLEQALATPIAKRGADARKFTDTYYAPKFEDYLDICKRGGKVAVIELKDRLMSEQEIDRVIELCEQKGVEYNFGSFHFEKLRYIRNKNDTVGLHLFTIFGLPRDMADAGASSKDKLNAVIEQRINISCDYQFISKSMSDLFHSAGLFVGVWTVNDEKLAACLYFEYGVDYITTDKRPPV